MTDYYFGEGGNDANAGTSYATRKVTYANVVSTYSPGAGDTVYICAVGGTWTCTEQINMRSGSSGLANHFRLSVNAGDTILMDVNTPTREGAINFSNVQYCTVEPQQGKLILGDITDWTYDNYDGYTADRQFNIQNSSYIAFIGTGTGYWDTTDSNLVVHGGSDYYGNSIYSDSDHVYFYGVDISLHGTNDSWTYPPNGNNYQDWGEMVQVWGDNIWFHRCAFKEGGHQVCHTRGHKVLYTACDFSGYHRGGDELRANGLASQAYGSRCTDLGSGNASNGGRAPYGPSCIEHSRLHDSDASDQADQAILKIESWAAIFRGNYVYDNLNVIQSNPNSDHGNDESVGRIKIYHNTMYNNGGVWHQNSVGDARTYPNMFEYCDFLNNICDQIGQVVFYNPGLYSGRKHIMRTAAGELNSLGSPTSWKYARWNGNIFNRPDGPIDIGYRGDGGDLLTSITGAISAWPSIFGAANRENYITAPTYAGVPATGDRSLATFAPGGGYETGMAVPISSTSSVVPSSTTVPLQTGQAAAWHDGWDLGYFGATGDTIYFSEIDETRVITAVNLTTDTITVDTAVTLSNNSPIYWVPDGTNPAFDIGAGQSNSASGGDTSGGGTSGGTTPPPPPAGTSSITFVGAGTPVSLYEPSGTPGVILGFPAGLQDGDFMIAVTTRTDDAGTLAAPAGWTKVAEVDSTLGSDCSLGVFTKVASGESGTVTFSHDDPARQSVGGVIVAYRDLDGTTQLDATTTTDATVIDSATAAPPAITTVTNKARVVVIGSVRAYTTEAASFSPPTGYTERVDYSVTDSRFIIADKEVSTAGTETPGVITAAPGGGTTDWALATLALRPATTSPTVSSSTQIRVSMKIGLSGTITL